MCLQDIKLAKSYEVRGREVIADGGPTDIRVNQAGNRRLIRFAFGPNVDPTNFPILTICWLPAGSPIALGILKDFQTYIELDFQTHGAICYGPFSFVDWPDIDPSVSITELLANTDEESVV